MATLAQPTRAMDRPAAESAVLLLAAASLLYSASATTTPRDATGRVPFPVSPENPAVCAPWGPATVQAAVEALCGIERTLEAAALLWAALVVMPPAALADGAGADAERPPAPLAAAVQGLILQWAPQEELVRYSLVADLCRAVFASASACLFLLTH